MRGIFYLSEVPVLGGLFRVFHTLVDVLMVFLPFLGLIILGLIVGKGVYLLFSRFLRIIHFDRLFALIEDKRLFTPSLSVARFFYFFVVLVFFMHAVEYIIFIEAADIIGELLTIMEGAFVFFSLIMLVYFAAHYLGSLLELLVDITGFSGGVYVYYGFLTLSFTSFGFTVFQHYQPLEHPWDILASFLTAVFVISVIFFRKEIRQRLEREES